MTLRQSTRPIATLNQPGTFHWSSIRTTARERSRAASDRGVVPLCSTPLNASIWYDALSIGDRLSRPAQVTRVSGVTGLFRRNFTDRQNSPFPLRRQRGPRARKLGSRLFRLEGDPGDLVDVVLLRAVPFAELDGREVDVVPDLGCSPRGPW